MKKNRFVTLICACFVIFFSGVAVYLYEFVLTNPINNHYKELVYVLIAQAAFFVIISIAAMFNSNKFKFAVLTPTLKKLVLMSQAGEVQKEIDLSNRQSILIGKENGADIDLSHITDVEATMSEHAVLNLASNYWYIEAVSNEYKVGLQHDGNNMIYTLKKYTPYKLAANDIIHIAGAKIIVK